MSEYGFTPKQAKRLTARKGNKGYCVIEDRQGIEWLVIATVDNGRLMRICQMGSDGKKWQTINANDYNDFKITLNGDEVT